MSALLTLALALLALIIAAGSALHQRRRAQQLAAELAGLRAGLADSNRLASLGNLVAGLVHEINTPIGALHSNHDVLTRALARLQAILADERVDAAELNEVRKIARALHEIIGVNTLAVERVDQLVKSLRSFGRPGRSEIAWADLHEGIDSTLAITGHELALIDVVKDYGALPLVLCRPQQLNQVFMNLLVNARQAMPDRGTLTIRTRHDNLHVTVTIADTGCGIAPENSARIFQPGFTTKGARVGMGMGLLIARQIVEQHQGRIEVRSTPDTGSEFTITLPVAPATLRQEAALAAEPASA
ncbi:MAG: sensor histidine kinase [Gemmatimonadota bacterium]